MAWEDPHEASDQSMKGLMGPGAVDACLRQAIMMCWTMLPQDKRSVKHVAAEVRRLLDRALSNLQEDAEEFGYGQGQDDA